MGPGNLWVAPHSCCSKTSMRGCVGPRWLRFEMGLKSAARHAVFHRSPCPIPQCPTAGRGTWCFLTRDTFYKRSISSNTKKQTTSLRKRLKFAMPDLINEPLYVTSLTLYYKMWATSTSTSPFRTWITTVFTPK